MADLRLEFHAVSEPQPGPRWQRRFEDTWPGFRSWYLRDGDAARPAYPVARRMLETHMPELVGAWERMVALAGGGDVAARMLSLYNPPPLLTGCSQAVFARPEPLLVRNYDFDPALLEGVIYATELVRPVLGMRDCLWGLLDGINDAGLAVSLAFGGRRALGPGFAVPLVVRYLLEVCDTTGQALSVLRRLPVQAAYNLTIVDRAGAAATARIGPDRPVGLAPVAVATNHQERVEWPEHATAFASVEREGRLLDLLDAAGGDPVATFLEPPLHARAYASGFGTLYTAVHRPATASVEYLWPGERWRQSLDAFEGGSRTIWLPGEKSSRDWSHA